LRGSISYIANDINWISGLSMLTDIFDNNE